MQSQQAYLRSCSLTREESAPVYHFSQGCWLIRSPLLTCILSETGAMHTQSRQIGGRPTFAMAALRLELV